jgi:hypothetical protein
MLTRFHHRQVFGNKDGNPTLIYGDDSDANIADDFFARVGAQIARHADGGKLEIYFSYAKAELSYLR